VRFLIFVQWVWLYGILVFGLGCVCLWACGSVVFYLVRLCGFCCLAREVLFCLFLCCFLYASGIYRWAVICFCMFSVWGFLFSWDEVFLVGVLF